MVKVDMYMTQILASETTMEPVYSGHPWDTTNWLFYGGDLLITIDIINGKLNILLQQVKTSKKSYINGQYQERQECWLL